MLPMVGGDGDLAFELNTERQALGGCGFLWIFCKVCMFWSSL